MRRPLLAILSCSLALAGCISTSDPAPTTVAAAPVVVTGPPACAQPIREYLTVIDRDVETGNLNREVHQRASNDLFGVRSHCSAGRVGPALTDLAEIKRRYGYH